MSESNDNVNDNANGTSNALGYPLLQCKDPVPSDIQVSQDIVKEVGLLSIADLAKQYVPWLDFFVPVSCSTCSYEYIYSFHPPLLID